MNTIGIALVWCLVQVTAVSLLAGGLYLLIRRVRPAAAAPIVFTALVVVAALSLLAFSPWPRWKSAFSPLPPGEGQGLRAELQERTGDGGRHKAESTEPIAGGKLPPEQAEPQMAETIPLDQDDARPSLATVFRQTVAEELSPQVETASWRWPAMVAMAMLAATACGLGWLLLGMAAIRRQRRKSRPVSDQEVLELVDVLRAELTCLRPVEVREAGDLTTAATIGWRRPVVLLPADWRSWTSEQRRAVLAHEIAHARSHDFLALLLGQLGLVLHFYHPLLHWLTNRLRLEQELAADAAAANISGGQRQYLSTIAELALRAQDRPMSWPARTFLPTQTTFLRRIAMLRDAKLRSNPLSPAARWTTVAVVLLCGLLAAGLRGPGRITTADAADTDKQAAPDTIVEGVGWRDLRVGMSREDVIKALGQPDANSRPDLLEWRTKHIACGFFGKAEADGATEIRFVSGFQGACANGIKVGSSGSDLLKAYGEPTHTREQNGAKFYEYSERGIMFWTVQGRITMLTVMKPYNPRGIQPNFTPVATTPAASGPIVEGAGCGSSEWA